MGWREKVETIFGLTEADLDTVPLKPKWEDPALAKLKVKARNHILACCKRFTEAQAESLLRWQEEDFCNPKHNPRNMARELENGTEYVFSTNNTKLHLGFATGFEGMTTVLHLLEHHRKIFADIMEMFSIGDSPSAWKTRKPGEAYLANPNKFPKSRRLATRPGEIIPMGWMEWVDDPNPSTPTVKSTSAKSVAEASKPAQPTGPAYLRGTLKLGAELDAQLIQAGNPGKFKLFVREDYLPEVEVKYAAGFKVEDLGRFARVRVKNVKGKEQITTIELIKFIDY
jgi:hypothetical protein